MLGCSPRGCSLPTTINETKATLLLLPVALLVPALLDAAQARSSCAGCSRSLGIGALAVDGVRRLYNYLIQYRRVRRPDRRVLHARQSCAYYLYTGAANTDQPYVGRFDSIEIALEHTSARPAEARLRLRRRQRVRVVPAGVRGQVLRLLPAVRRRPNASDAVPVGNRRRRPARVPVPVLSRDARLADARALERSGGRTRPALDRRDDHHDLRLCSTRACSHERLRLPVLVLLGRRGEPRRRRPAERAEPRPAPQRLPERGALAMRMGPQAGE